MASEKIQKAWSRAEADIKKGNYAGVVDLMRETDSEGQHAMTWYLAGIARREEAKASGAASTYRQAAKNLRTAMQMDRRTKRYNTAYNDLLNEMNEKRIGEYLIPPLLKDGTPTLTSFGLMGVVFLAVLFALSQAGNSPALTGDEMVRMSLTWTDADGTDRSGDVTIQIHADAPSHASSFLQHVNEGTYDGTIFHRVIDGFMIQGGDFENGDGTGGYAASWHGYCNGQAEPSSSACGQTQYTLPDEVSNGRLHDTCTLSMAKTGQPHTGGSQFFLIPEDSNDGQGPSWLDGQHTVFGTITDGCEHVTSISNVETGNTDDDDATSGDGPTSQVTLVEAVSMGADDSPWYVFW
jgi:cyclophilin family peptidyl-prolyl cis-trans isomerase